MAQKFELDPNRPPEEQFRKTEFNDEKKEVLIHYHLKEGQIFREPYSIPRNDLIQQGNDMNEKDQEKSNAENKRQQFFKMITENEQKCFSVIKQH